MSASAQMIDSQARARSRPETAGDSVLMSAVRATPGSRPLAYLPTPRVVRIT